MNCKACGKPTERSYGGMCQGCYLYFRKGGKIHPLPAHGMIERDEYGKPICHICGRSYTRLGSHIKESHGMTIAEYKEEFGLCNRTNTTEQSYSEMMRENALNNEMDKRILHIGANTRIKKGQTDMRKGKKARQQEIIDKRNRKLKK